jgi:hypothetical protein
MSIYIYIDTQIHRDMSIYIYIDTQIHRYKSIYISYGLGMQRGIEEKKEGKNYRPNLLRIPWHRLQTLGRPAIFFIFFFKTAFLSAPPPNSWASCMF